MPACTRPRPRDRAASDRLDGGQAPRREPTRGPDRGSRPARPPDRRPRGVGGGCCGPRWRRGRPWSGSAAGRFGLSLRPVRARAGGPLAGGRRPFQRRDRQRAVHHAQDGQRPRDAHPQQARCLEPHRGSAVRGPIRARCAASGGGACPSPAVAPSDRHDRLMPGRTAPLGGGHRASSSWFAARPHRRASWWSTTASSPPLRTGCPAIRRAGSQHPSGRGRSSPRPRRRGRAPPRPRTCRPQA